MNPNPEDQGLPAEVPEMEIPKPLVEEMPTAEDAPPLEGAEVGAAYAPSPDDWPVGISFSVALQGLESGQRWTRKGWNGEGMFIFLVPGSRFEVNRPPLLGIYPEGTTVDYHAHIDMRTADGFVVPWIASHSDLLARDWCPVLSLTEAKENGRVE